MSKKLTLPICIALVALVISGCSSVNIINQSDKPVTVIVKLPDRSSITSFDMDAQNSIYLSSNSGGPYSVKVISQVEYLQQIDDIQSAYAPFFNTGSGQGQENLEKPWQASWRFTNQEETAENAPGSAKCYGNVGDNAEVEVTITWHEQANAWFAECTSAEGQGIDWSFLIGF